MLGILDVEPDMLNEFSESAQRELNFVDKIMNKEKIKDYHNMLTKTFRAIHMIKGNASLLNIEYFAQATHDFEDMISSIKKKSKINDEDIHPLREKLQELQKGIEEMENIIDRMGQVHAKKGDYKGVNTSSLLQSLENLINGFSNDLGKKIKFNHENFEGHIIPNKYHLLVKEILVQLIRNSISHGIEPPDERKRLNKPQYGIIELSTYKKNGTIEIRLRDDGRGIQIERLKETAIKSGRWKAEEIDQWSHQQIADLIFISGITTSEKANMLAGRGVGMDGVKHRIIEHQGEIHVHFDQDKYCEFEINLPEV